MNQTAMPKIRLFLMTFLPFPSPFSPLIGSRQIKHFEMFVLSVIPSWLKSMISIMSMPACTCVRGLSAKVYRPTPLQNAMKSSSKGWWPAISYDQRNSTAIATSIQWSIYYFLNEELISPKTGLESTVARHTLHLASGYFGHAWVALTVHGAGSLINLESDRR